MEEFLKLDIKKKIYYFIVMAALLLIMVIPVIMSTTEKNVESNDIVLDDRWTVTVNDKVYKDVTLSKFRFDMGNRGDILTFEHVIPRYDTTEDPTINLYSIHATVKVSVDNEVIYQYGQDRYQENKLLGYGRHFIPLGKNQMGKKLTIEMHISENNAFDGQQPVIISDGRKFVSKDIAGKRFNLAISMFLMVFGVIIMILSMLMLKSSVNFIQTFCIAMFSFLVGCWTLCNMDLIEYFSSDLLVKTYMEYMTFYVLPLPFTYYFRDRLEEKGFPKWLKIYFKVLIIAEIAFAAFAYTMQFFNIMHLPSFLSGAHILMVLALLFIVFINIWARKNSQNSINSVMVGFAIAVILTVIELMRFNINKYLFGFSKNEYSSKTCFAVLIIVISLLVDYGKKISQTLYRIAQQQLFKQMAYMDELTGLANRRKCEEYMKELETHTEKYCILCFDLNLLKKINDTYGHEKGDELIKRFADVLREVYSLYGITARIGGDEFVAILNNVSVQETEKLISNMLILIETKNKEDDILKLSTAYGYVMSDEVADSNPHIIYKLADDRMYEYKKKSKMGRND
nr:GGDEF domain-containing protein [uncultured Agathobacter sp.]